MHLSKLSLSVLVDYWYLTIIFWNYTLDMSANLLIRLPPLNIAQKTKYVELIRAEWCRSGKLIGILNIRFLIGLLT